MGIRAIFYKLFFIEDQGFPIGGVAALDFKEGGISPGGVGLIVV